MSNYNDGGPAFPCTNTIANVDGEIIRVEEHNGISTRLYIAAKFLLDIVKSSTAPLNDDCKQALAWADKLIAQDKADRESGK